jgi:hypothetical protein
MTTGIKNETLVAENVEVDMETLSTSMSFLVPSLTRRNALIDVRDAVIKALSPDDREKLEAYIKGE